MMSAEEADRVSVVAVVDEHLLDEARISGGKLGESSQQPAVGKVSLAYVGEADAVDEQRRRDILVGAAGHGMVAAQEPFVHETGEAIARGAREEIAESM